MKSQLAANQMQISFVENKPISSLMAEYKGLLKISAFILLFALRPPGLRADVLLYDNGADNHDFTNVITINSFHHASDEFTISATATLDKIIFAEDVLILFGGPATPKTIDWCIGTAAFAGDIGCGTGAITPTSTAFSDATFTNFVSELSLPSLPVAPGNYFLTLGNATDTGLGNDYWGTTGASPDATLSFKNPVTGIVTTSGTSGEPSFQIFGTTGSPSAVPEPGTLALLVLALIPTCALAPRRR
ncbi:MAG TPA: PEP-CTERM sorting domain-containing protein [Bryobacteraceae bacterium]|nr:PEP-CTERM sorting domain-containing protein [Bryobacteraceae bacterium]